MAAAALVAVGGLYVARRAPRQAPPSPKAPSAAPHKPILGVETPVYSMSQEEVIIRDFFQDRRGGFFVDVGCAHPIHNSNTFYLEERLGWTGFGIDALPELAPKWRRRRRESRFFNYIVTDHSGGQEAFFRAEPRVIGISSLDKPRVDPAGQPVASERIVIPTITLTKLLDDNGVRKIDLLSIDIEGAEPLALAGFDVERFRPELVCIEAKVANRAFLLEYFRHHGYRRIESYLRYDQTNYYFTPAGR